MLFVIRLFDIALKCVMLVSVLVILIGVIELNLTKKLFNCPPTSDDMVLLFVDYTAHAMYLVRAIFIKNVRYVMYFLRNFMCIFLFDFMLNLVNLMLSIIEVHLTATFDMWPLVPCNSEFSNLSPVLQNGQLMLGWGDEN